MMGWDTTIQYRTADLRRERDNDRLAKLASGNRGVTLARRAGESLVRLGWRLLAPDAPGDNCRQTTLRGGQIVTVCRSV